MFLRFVLYVSDIFMNFADFDISGSDFDILGILGIWDECAVFVFHLSLSFICLANFAESCFFPFLGGANN